MRVEKCVLSMEDRGEASITMPPGVFEYINTPCRFVAVKKDSSNIIKLILIEGDDKVFGIYAEVEYGTLSMFIGALTQFIKVTEGVTFVPELVGTCPGSMGTPCIFDGILLARESDDLDIIKESLIEVKKNDIKIVKTLEIREVTNIHDQDRVIGRLSTD